MAYFMKVLSASFESSVDLSNAQFLGVVIDANEQIALPTADGEFSIGVLQGEPDDEQYAGVMVYGITKMVFGAELEAGTVVSVDADGKAKEAVAGEYILGVAVVGAGVDEIGSVLLKSSRLEV